MFDPQSVFEFLADKCAIGLRTVLVTIAKVVGSSTREAGTMMAVCENGEHHGSISGGCLEVAIAAQAQNVLAYGEPRLITFGAGSKFVDIRLPCGGSVDLLFSPMMDGCLVRKARDILVLRQPLILHLDRQALQNSCSIGNGEVGVAADVRYTFVSHVPRLRLIVLGTGDVVTKLYHLARQIGIDIVIGSQDEQLLSKLAADPATLRYLKTPTSSFDLVVDKWTAFSLLFHDHDWEPQILARIVPSPAFLIGAMGSRRTHKTRMQLLEELGVDRALASRIASPIGLIHSMRDPETLAVSVLAQVVGEFNRRYLSARTSVAPNAGIHID